jgi:predicted dehydrogenase
MSETIRVGVIGAGINTTLMHIPGFQAIDGVEVVSVANRSRESGQRVADEFGIPAVADTWADVIDDPGVDAICIGTWPYMHRTLVLASLDAGKHVLTEARMAMNAAEAHKMLEAARNSDRVTQIVPSPMGFRGHNAMTRMLRHGFVGEPYEVVVRFLSGDLLDREAPLHWRQKPEYSGLNVLILGIVNETLTRWLGDTTRVLASTRVFITPRRDPESGEERPVEVPDSVTVLADMACGARAIYHLSGVALAAPGSAIEIYGSEGTLVYDFQEDAIRAARLGAAELHDIDILPHEEMGWSVEADFIASIREGAPVRFTSFEDGVKYMEFIEAVSRSATSAQAVELPLVG